MIQHAGVQQEGRRQRSSILILCQDPRNRSSSNALTIVLQGVWQFWQWCRERRLLNLRGLNLRFAAFEMALQDMSEDLLFLIISIVPLLRTPECQFARRVNHTLLSMNSTWLINATL